MKALPKYAKRFLALVLVFGLLVSNMAGLSLTADAASAASKTTAAVIAENYALSDAEKALLESGLLAGGSMDYTVPDAEDNLISVDTDNKVISAEAKYNFVPVSAVVVVNGADYETVALTDGKGTYTYDGNAFSVKVAYELKLDVDAALQEQLLGTGAWLKQGVANLDAVSAQGGNLYILEQAMPELVNFANNGVSTPLGSVNFSADCKNAISALNGQMTANGGKLDLSVAVDSYDSASAKTYYLFTDGKDMQADVVALYANVSLINEALTTMVDNLALFIQNGWVSEDLGNQLKTLAGVCKNLVDGLATVSADPWTAANEGATKLLNVQSGAMWQVELAKIAAKLDPLVAALGAETAVTVTNPLKVAETSIQHNLAMWNVTVNFKLNQIVNNVPALNSHVESVVLTLADGASKAEVLAAIEASGAEAAALAAWGIDTDFFVRSEVTGMGDELTADTKIEYFYNPQTYAVSYDYAAAETLPYGYVITLPKHEVPTQAYDYTVNGVPYAQGSEVKVEGELAITRTEGKAYTSTDLYTVVANNFANDVAKNILTSGALKDNTAINYREPDPADAESLLKLEDGVLTAKDAYASDYASLDWFPYTYGAEKGTENYFNGDYDKEWAGDSAKVQYVLAFTNFGQAKAQEVLDLAATLKAEAADQKSVMDGLAGMKDTLEMLDKAKLGALNGVIDVTDFTEGDGTDTDAENLEIRAELKGIVSAIIANNLGSDNLLKIYGMVVEYENGGLKYYYENYDTIYGEVNSLSGYLGNLMDNEEALKIMCSAAGFPEYAEKISGVEEKLNGYLAAMKAPNAAIDTESANLGKLVTALTADGSAESTATGSPYVLSKVLTAMDASKVMVQVVIETSKGGATVTTAEMDKNAVLEQTVADKLEADVNAKVAELLGANAKYYALSADKTVDSLVGTEIAKTTTLYYTYTANAYTVKIDGEADQTVTIEDLEINLPKHPAAPAWTYEYTIDGVEGITKTSYTFTAEQIDRLFAGGSYTITREAIDQASEKLDNAFGAWVVKDSNGVATGLNANLAGAGEIMNLAMTFVNSGYTYIGFNGEGFLYLNAEDTLEISMQTLINAILKDNSFSDETIVALGENGKGKLVAASLQLGNSADELIYEDLDFVLSLESVPSQLTDNVGALKTAFNYVSFKSNNGVLDVEINLPDQVYAAYAAALITTGYVAKDDVNGIEQAVAMQFLLDYVDAIIASGADMETFTNTLAELGQNKDLTAYNKIYNGAVSGYQNYVTVDAATGAVAIDLPGQKTIDGLLNFAGVDKASFATYLGMLKEYKADGKIVADGTAALANLDKTYYALIVDAQAAGIANKAEAPASYAALADELATLAGYSAVILTADIPGDLTIAGTTVLDLNGFDVNGAINATGTLYIVDSSMDTAAAGTVSGAVSGNVSVFGGSYKQGLPASALKDGYKLVGENVQNALYTISEDNGNVTFNLNSDVIDETIDSYTTFAKAVAVDLAADIVLNYYTAAALSADGAVIYDVNVEDLVALYNSGSKVNEAIDVVLGSVNVPGIGEFVETVINDMLDFEAVNAALVAGTPVATYTLTTEPWQIGIDKSAENYVEVSIISNDAKAKSFDVSVVVGGANVDRIIDLTSQLADIEAKGEVDIVLEKVERDGSTIPVKGSIVVTVSADLTASEKHEAYITAIAAVIGDAELIAALNANDDVNAEAVQNAFNAITVKEIFDAAKALNRTDSFAKMANAAGLSYDAADLADIEAAYKLVVCAAGKALEKLEITGPSTKMGNFADGEGAYSYAKNNVNRTPSFSVRGYTIAADLTASGRVELTIFGEAETPVVPGCNHSNTTVIPGYAATCTKTGLTDGLKCADCGVVLERQTVIPALGHIDEDKNNLCDRCGINLGGGVIKPPVDENGCAHYNKNCGVKCHVELYTDLSADKWYHEYIDYVVCRGLMIGIEEDVFAPNMTTTRAMIVTTLYRIENCPEVTFEQHYEDVAGGLWYSDAIAWATENGIVEGYGDGTFGPRNTVTREQMALILYRYIDYKGFNVDVEYDLGDYKDAESVHAWAQDAMEWAVGIGMINGISETEMVLDPLGGTARSHVAALLTRLCVNFEL